MIPAFSVAIYLRGLKGVTYARPVQVTIGTETFLGALYTQDERTGRRFYLLGETPVVWRKAGRNRDGESKLIFTFDGATFYAGGGYTPFLLKPWGSADFTSAFGGADLRQYHPFGHYFDVSEWPTNERTAAGDLFGEIDKYDAKPRKRLGIRVEFLA